MSWSALGRTTQGSLGQVEAVLGVGGVLGQDRDSDSDQP